jgi:uncharacterized protein YecE (DUF72 family)
VLSSSDFPSRHGRASGAQVAARVDPAIHLLRERWMRDIVKWKKQRRDVYVYFDNQKSAAPADAARLKEMLG